MSKFSLRQLFIGIMALAVGLAFSRLSAARWIDVPLLILSFYFAMSLWRQAIATRRLARQGNLPREQRWGGRILVAQLLGMTALLAVAWIVAFLIAAELLPAGDEFKARWFQASAQDLACLTMLLAISMSSWRSLPVTVGPIRRQLIAPLAAGGALVTMLVYWAYQTLLWFVIYAVISNGEMAQRPALLPPELNESAVTRMQRFALGGAVGLLLVIVNGPLLAALAKRWSRPRVRRTTLALLAVGLAGQSAVAAWIAGPGLRQLSQPMWQAAGFRWDYVTLTVTATTLLAATVFSWRAAAKRCPTEQTLGSFGEPYYLHEHWLGCCLLSVAAAATLAFEVGAFYRQSRDFGWAGLHTGSFNWEVFGYAFVYRPAEFIWQAAILGALALGWRRWGQRGQPVESMLPCVDPAQFATLLIATLVGLVTAAPIIAAVSVSFWFLYAGIL